MAPRTPSGSRRDGRPSPAVVRARLAAPLAVAALAVAAYAGTLVADFTLDDVEIVRDNPRLGSLRNLPRIWSDDYWGHVRYGDHGLYRPVTLTTYAVQRTIHGPRAAPFHAVNVLLHAIASVALLGVVRSLFGDHRTAIAAGVLFAVHPLHVEAVAGIVGRAEILGFVGMLGAIAASRRAIASRTTSGAAGWSAAAAVAYFGGATSKESAIVAPAVVVLSEVLAPVRGGRTGTRRLGLLAAFAVAVAAFLALRARAVSAWNVSVVFENVSGSERILTALRVFGEYAVLLLVPFRLSADYGPGQVPIARSAAESGVLLGALVLAGLVALAMALARRQRAVAWGLATYLVLLLPMSNLLFPIGVAKAERILYAPSAGFLVALAGAGAAATAGLRRRAIGTWLLGAVTLGGLGLTWDRCRDWRDNCTLAAATLETAPDSPFILTMHGRCLLEAGRMDEARSFLEQALARRPDFPTAHLVLAELEDRAGRPEAALAHAEAILANEPAHVGALSRAAVLLARLGRPAEAAERYAQWRRADPLDPRPCAGLIKALFESGRFDAAQAVAREATSRFPGDELVRQNAAALEHWMAGEGASR